MELALNLAWVLLAATMICLWIRFAPRETSPWTQLVALAVVLLILLPAISMTDDLLAIQNPAEADCCVRQDHKPSNPHSVLSAVATLPLQSISSFSFGTPRLLAPGIVCRPTIESPALASIQNRPPPFA